MYVQYVTTMPPFKLPKDKDVLSLKDSIKHGPIIITAALIDVYNPYHDMAQLLFETNNFAELSKGILREYMVLGAKGQQLKYGELAETLLDVKRYEQPKRKKVCQGRGVDLISDERQVLGYGYTNIKMLKGALYDRHSPVRNEDSIEVKYFRCGYGVPWEVFIKLIREFQRRCQVHQHISRLTVIPFKLWILACLQKLHGGG
jgi:hypothetical protein